MTSVQAITTNRIKTGSYRIIHRDTNRVFICNRIKSQWRLYSLSDKGVYTDCGIYEQLNAAKHEVPSLVHTENQKMAIENAKQRALLRIQTKRAMQQDEHLQALIARLKKEDRQRKTMPLGYNEIQVSKTMSMSDMQKLRAYYSNQSHIMATFRRNQVQPVQVLSSGELQSRKKAILKKNKRSWWLLIASYDGKNIDLLETECTKCTKGKKNKILRNDCEHKNLNHNGLIRALSEHGITLSKKQADKLKKLISATKKNPTITPETIRGKVTIKINRKELVIDMRKISD